MGSRVRAGVLALTILSSLVGCGSGGSGGPTADNGEPELAGERVPAGFDSWGQLFDVQAGLDRAADRLAAVAEQPRDTGYAGTITEPTTRTLRLFWKGALPEQVAKLVEELRTTVSVKVQPASFTRAQLMAALDKIAASVVAQPGNGITSIAPAPDGSALQVSVAAATQPADLVAKLGVAVKVQVTTGVRPVLIRGTSPRSDQPPYWGGAEWISSGAALNHDLGWCTTGFAVRQSGVTKMLAAGHCANDADVASFLRTRLGTVEQKDARFDTLLIRGANNFTGSFYTNTGLRADGQNRGVLGAEPNHNGDMVCMSGSFSGARCGAIVTAIDCAIPIYGDASDGSGRQVIVGVVRQLVRAWGLRGSLAGTGYKGALAGNGDSGGPVYVPRGRDSFEQLGMARGILEAIDTGPNDIYKTACPGAPSSPTRICASLVYYVDLARTLQRYQATIEYGPSVVGNPECVAQRLCRG